MQLIATNALQLADIIRLSPEPEPFADAIVNMITVDEVHCIRPYMHHADFSYTGGVICYTGHDTFKLSRTQTNIVLLVRKGPALR